jgi:DNA-directed RNA polymerase specialized sigma24 family protein
MTGIVSSAPATTPASWQASAVEQAVAGDEVAFSRIVEAYHRDLVRVAYVVAGDEGLGEDAAQAAWSIAWRKLGTLRDPERLRPWLVAIAANEARKLVQSRQRRRVTEIRVRAPDDPAGDLSAGIDHLDLALFLAGLSVMLVAIFRTPEYRLVLAEEAEAARTPSAQRSLVVVQSFLANGLYMLAVVLIPIVILLGVAPDLEAGLYFALVVPELLGAAWLLLWLVFSQRRPASA